MLDLINSKNIKIHQLGMGVELKVDFQSLSFSDPLPPNIGIPHGTNDLSDTPRYGKALDKRSPAGANIDRPKAGQIGEVSKLPQNQPMVPGATVHQINRTNNGHHAMSIRPALADAGFSIDGANLFAEKLIDSSKCEKTGFTKRKKLVAFGDSDPSEAVELVSYHNNLGHYIGDEKVAMFLYEKGIQPELASDDNKVCSVGYCEREDKWYGWSHRAVHGFGKGDTITKGDCGFAPATPEDAVEDISRFYNEDCPKDCRYIARLHRADEDKFTIRLVKQNYDAREAGIDRDKMHIPAEEAGWSYEEPSYIEVPRGAGEWSASTRADARNMACEFARSVSSAPVEEGKHLFSNLIYKEFIEELEKVFNSAKKLPAFNSNSFSSESSSAVYPPANFRWYRATKGGRTKFADIRDPEVEYNVEKGDKVGVYLNADGNVHLVTEEDLGYMFVLTPNQAKNIIKNSAGYGGKISGVQVKRGNGSVDEVRAAKPLGRSRDIHSTKLKVAPPKKVEVLRKPRGKVTVVPNPDAKVYIAFFKPDLDRDRYAVYTDTNKKRLTKTVVDAASAKTNLGSEVFVGEIPDSHPLSKKSSNGQAFVRTPIINKLRDNVKVKALDTKLKVGAMSLELPIRNPTPVNIDVPFGPGIEILALRKLRDQIEQHKKISAAFSVRVNPKQTKAQDRGIFKHSSSVNVLQFISPDSSKVYEIEAKAFVRRIKGELGNMFKATWAKSDVVENNQKVERVILTVFPNMKKGDAQLRKWNKMIYRMIEARDLDKNGTYIARTGSGDIEVRLKDVNWLKGRFIVKPERANLDAFETDHLWSLTGRNKIV